MTFLIKVLFDKNITKYLPESLVFLSSVDRRACDQKGLRADIFLGRPCHYLFLLFPIYLWCCYSTLTLPWVTFTNIVTPRRQWRSSCSWDTQSYYIPIIHILLWCTAIPNTEKTPINWYFFIFMNKSRPMQYWGNRKITT